jgi:hypothetical protein
VNTDPAKKLIEIGGERFWRIMNHGPGLGSATIILLQGIAPVVDAPHHVDQQS